MNGAGASRGTLREDYELPLERIWDNAQINPGGDDRCLRDSFGGARGSSDRRHYGDYVVLNQLMLTNSEVYVLPKSLPVSKLAIGSKVKVTYTSSNGVNSVSAVARVK